MGSAVNGSVAEWSKALDLGSSLSGGVGSNPTAIILILSNIKSRKISLFDLSRFSWSSMTSDKQLL